jgi:hypothetical protein
VHFYLFGIDWIKWVEIGYSNVGYGVEVSTRF